MSVYGGSSGKTGAPVLPGAVAAAAVAYEARWSYAALRRVDAELLSRFDEQKALYWDAVASGDEAAVAEQSGGMVRAYQAITRAMEAQPDDAYVVGQDPRTGLKIAIGSRVAPATRLPDGVVYLTADEVAMLLAEQAGFTSIAKIKMLFPGSSIEACRQDAKTEELQF
jgi:hypothetical protein